MLIHVANFFEADRRSAVAAGVIPLGSVCVATQGTTAASRSVTPVTTDADIAKTGAVSIVIKVSSDPLQVDSSTVPTELGNRLVAIKAGDAVVECRAGSIVAYDPSLLDASLDPARAGTLPVVGVLLGVKAGLPCALGAASALIAAPILKVYDIVGGKVRIQLLSK